MELEHKTRDKIVKLLNMLRSDNEGEVINAASAVSIIIKKNNLSWNGILVPPQSGINPLDETLLADAVNRAAAQNNIKASDFFYSLLTYFREHGQLTEKQTRAFKNWCRNL